MACAWKRSRPTIAADGDTALELLTVNAYDIAVLDRDIPGPSGDEIARWTSPATISAPYLTDYTSSEFGARS